MAEIEIYTTQSCPYCVRAKMLFSQKDVSYNEIDATDPAVRTELLKKSGGQRTVPQIFINGEHIGGCDDLYELNSKGELDKLLG